MKIFLSYPSEERELAYRLQLAMAANGHDVFFDREDLPAGQEYDQAIARGIVASDLFVFLITPAAVQTGRYTLTELGLAEDKWRHPSGRVLPVIVRETPIAAVPVYARAVNIFTPRGDVVAETAHEVQRMARDLSLPRRIGRRIRSRAGLAALGSAVAVGGAAWLASVTPGAMLGSPGDSAAADTTVRATPLPDDLRHRARAVAPTDSGFVLAVAAPSQLIRFTPNGIRVGQPIALMGEPTSALRSRTQILVVTRAMDGITAFDATDLRVIDTVSLDPARVGKPTGGSALPRPSGDIRSVAIGRGNVWVVTGDRDGEPTLLRYRMADRGWDIPSWAAKPEGFGLDARGLRVRLIGERIWGVTAETTPSSLYQFVYPFRIDEFGGHDIGMVSCAHDLAESADGNLLFLSCDNELQEVRLDEDRKLKLVRATPTLPNEGAPGNWTHELIVRADSAVIVALNTQLQGASTPARARIVEVTFSPGGSARTLLDESGAIVVSMAATPRSVVAVLRRANGTLDAVSVSRRR